MSEKNQSDAAVEARQETAQAAINQAGNAISGVLGGIGGSNGGGGGSTTVVSAPSLDTNTLLLLAAAGVAAVLLFSAK